MPVTVETQDFWIRGDVSNKTQPRAVNQGDRTLNAWKGMASKFRVTHFFATELGAVSNLSFVTLELKTPADGEQAPADADVPRVKKILAAADFNADATAEEFAAFSASHFEFALSNEEMGQTGKIWLLIYATTIAGNTLTLAAGIIEFIGDGGPSLTNPDPVEQGAWDKAEADARFMLATGWTVDGSGNLVFPEVASIGPDGLKIWSPDDAEFVPLTLTGTGDGRELHF